MTYENFQKEYDKLAKEGKVPILNLKELAKQVYMELKVNMVGNSSPTFPIDFDVEESQFRKVVKDFSKEIECLAKKDGLRAIIICHRDLPKEKQQEITEITRKKLYEKMGPFAEVMVTAKDVRTGLKNRVYVLLKKV